LGTAFLGNAQTHNNGTESLTSTEPLPKIDLRRKL